MNRLKYSLLTLLLLISYYNTELSGQDPLKRFSFKNIEQTSLSIPFKMYNNLIIIPATINNSDTLNFILDTGLNTTILSELNWQDSISLVFAREIQLQGLGQGEPVYALHSYGNNITISDITGNNQDIYVLLDNSFNLSAKMGVSVNGILGYPLFKNFIVSINYTNSTITFHKPESFYSLKKYRRYKTIPISVHDTKPYINVLLTDNNGVVHNIKLLIDTGASHAIWLDESTMPDLIKPENKKYTLLGSGLNGKVFGEVARLQWLDIGNFKIKNPVVAFPDSSSLLYAAGMDLRNGSIGSDILKRFNLIIDYNNSEIRVRPNKFFHKPFNVNLSGMEIIAPYAGLKIYFVENVMEGSPAWKAGIRENDELVSINNVPVTQMQMSDIYHILQSKPGKKINIRFYRNDRLLSVTFKLEEFI